MRDCWWGQSQRGCRERRLRSFWPDLIEFESLHPHMSKYRTTSVEKSSEHRTWHKFRRGGCDDCGWHCEGCSKGVATCKCDGSIARADYLLMKETIGLTNYWSD
jgi:hypothetical protein